MRKGWGFAAGVLLLLAACAPQQGQEQNSEPASPKTVYNNNCASCHGGNLEGGAGPSLKKVGNRYSAKDIEQVIQNGKGQMPAQNQLSDQERSKLASWLAEKK
ncbi:cytochrome c551 [Melghirimyces thermohalophilus]|uniref:Cytochrome c551 n=1 Tax=Melghirimyces thermohalophilus TaxID=1236220 RepID=A0A1G6QRT7_9BACL|nr:cytochrome c [Melghirimyces thermohalophilus]SDC94436.1 cytochrome c551 [Melghirimyces thermohalophilus]